MPGARFHMLKAEWAACFSALLCLAAAPARGPGEATVTTLDTRSVSGTVTAISADAVVVRPAAGGARKLALGDVRSIVFADRPAAEAMAQPGRAVLLAEDGSALALRSPAVRDGKVRAATACAGDVAVGLDAVARLLLPRPHQTPAEVDRQVELLKLARGSADVLLVGAGGQWTAVRGVLDSLGGGRARLTYEDVETAMDANTVAALVPARVGKAPAAAEPAGHVRCTDGSRVAFASLSLAGGRVTAESASLGRLNIDAASVARIDFRSARLTYLSDLAPAEARQTPFFDEQVPWQRDERAGGGGPLRLGGRGYEKGLGLHARCELSWELGGAYRSFTAVAGIDDSVRAGAAVLTVTVDGKAAVKAVRLDRREPPQTIRIDVTGVRRLTVLADFAPGTFGSGARVDLCEAAVSK